jgi:ribosomal protein S12 methylthiotransferase
MAQTSKKVSVVTLGCSKNVVDSEVLLRQLQLNHFELTDLTEDSEVAVINTCGFIQSAKQESIDTILQAAALKKNGKLKRVVVMGCLSERYAEELREAIPEVDAFVGTNKIEQVVTLLDGNLKHELLGERKLTTPSHFAYLKISEGCNRTCAFCAIPLMRGEHRSKPIESILSEARQLASVGVKELILIAQESTYYGLDLGGKRMLGTLLDRLAEVDGIEWIRLMYAYPAGFPLDVLDRFEDHPKLCRYIDMPVQHIADPVLRSMRRGIASYQLRTLIDTIRHRVPGITLRTTLLVGYPTEGDNEFDALLAFVRETEFDRLGVFAYSQEDGTSAFPLGDPIPGYVKEERVRRIMETQRDISLHKNRSLVGQTVRVLIDEHVDGAAIGRTERDAPEIDNEVIVQGGAHIPVGHFCNIDIVDAEEYDLFATPPSPSDVANLRGGTA